MHAGQCTQVVTLLRLGQTVIEGELVESTTSLGTRFAQIESVSGGETRAAGQLRADCQHVVRLLSDAVTRTLTTADRITWSGRTLELLHIADRWNDGRWLEIQTKERS